MGATKISDERWCAFDAQEITDNIYLTLELNEMKWLFQVRPHKPKKTGISEISGSSSASISASASAYLSNFDNPYVKIIVVCKVCNKEQHMKRSADWKRHFLSHADNEEKPFKCALCDKAFVVSYQLKKHMAQHEKQAAKIEI